MNVDETKGEIEKHSEAASFSTVLTKKRWENNAPSEGG